MSIRPFSLCLLTAASCAAMSQTVINSSNMNSFNWYWQTTGSATGGFATGPGTPPYGVGSADLSVGSSGASGVHLRNTGYFGRTLASINSLAYSTFTITGNNLTPIMGLHVDWNGDSTVDDQLFFDPEYQHGYNNNLPDQGDNTNGVWHRWNALTGGWWSLNGIAGLGPGANVNTLATYLTVKPGARIINTATGLGGWRVFAGVGEGTWDNFEGFVDGMTLGVPNPGGFNDIYDFEPVPEPASLSVLALGALLMRRRRRRATW